ncbi:MAG: sodium ion-translocating decarboxylase subunit beta [Planctomycetes bacterium]|nr:sodium ion-translocating decarboxylase subunit beta [Planctomycetota bacterium]
MWIVALALLYLAIYKGFEPLLLVPIAFGALLANLPTQGIVNLPTHSEPGGLYYYISKGITWEIFPPLIFLGVGALTDFGPLIANPRTLLLGAAAQLGVFATFFIAWLLGFTAHQAASIGIIGGADGPTAIFTCNRLAPELLAPVAVAAYSYMSLVPLIQPPIMRLLTTPQERRIRMKSLRKVSKLEKLLFSLLVTVLCVLLVPAASALIAMLMLGGVLMGKLMNRMSPNNPINPLIGAAGVSAMPMAARVAQLEGQREDPNNYLLMHAMGPNVAGVIGTAVVAGYFIASLSK